MITRGTVRRIGVVAVVIMGFLAAGAAWWWTHATVLDDRFNGAELGMGPRPVERATLHVMAAIPDPHGNLDETLRFRSADVHFAENTAGATARLAVCVLRESVGPVGAVGGSLDRYCDEVRPVEAGTSMRRREGHDRNEYIVLTIEPTRPGVATVDRVEIEYSRDRAHLWQRGTASGELEVTVRATE